MKDNHSSDEHQQKVDVWEQMLSNYFYNKVLRPDTEKTYRKMVRLFLRYCGVCENALPLPDEVTHEHVLRWRRNELNIQKVRERTWNTKTRHMQSLYNYWIKKGIVSLKENPFSETQIEPGEKQKKVYTQSQLRTIYRILEQFQQQENMLPPDQAHFQACAVYPTRFWFAVLETLRLTAIRFNQLINLHIGDLDFEECTITLRSESSKNHREYQIAFVQPLRCLLAPLVEEMRCHGADKNDILFDVHRLYHKRLSRSETPLSQTIRSFFRRLSKECGFHVSPHRFRHTLATTLMKHPERNMQLTKQMLGHRSLSSTMEYIALDAYSTVRILENELGEFLTIGLGGELTRLASKRQRM
ncbi:site-specific integrase [Proteus mirabilis]|uniref:tyrosine-type recombinase/integrase n=1 Tax=Proteus mirabilis TaxID=584 RepID=UPI00257897D9|nr:site-specific integrase [Proteus mirabilis]MDM3573091.1 site-specific integrase [Proteus mirabilis]